MEKLRLALGMRPSALGSQAEEIDGLGCFSDSLQTRRATPFEMVAELLGSLAGNRPEQEQFVQVV
jgi:hypothetical protein